MYNRYAITEQTALIAEIVNPYEFSGPNLLVRFLMLKLLNRIAFLRAVLCAATILSGLGPATLTAQAPAPRAAWEEEIDAFEAADRLAPPSPRGILFVGSSSIREWPHLQSDFPGMRLLQRGFGGAEIEHVIHFADRIVFPYRPHIIVFYAGENDLFNGKTPQRVFADYKAFVALIRAQLPNTRIVFISIKPSPSRWSIADKIRQTNELIKGFIAKDPHSLFVDVYSPLLGTGGLPRPDLFQADRLHLNEDGYRIWRAHLEPAIHRLIRRS
jgi:hypothetical protein